MSDMSESFRADRLAQSHFKSKRFKEGYETMKAAEPYAQSTEEVALLLNNQGLFLLHLNWKDSAPEATKEKIISTCRSYIEKAAEMPGKGFGHSMNQQIFANNLEVLNRMQRGTGSVHDTGFVFMFTDDFEWRELGDDFIAIAGYNPINGGGLLVVTKHGNHMFFSGTKRSVFESLCSAQDKWRYFHDKVMGKYQLRTIVEPGLDKRSTGDNFRVRHQLPPESRSSGARNNELPPELPNSTESIMKDGKALFDLAVKHMIGKDCEQNIPKALLLLKASADLNYWEAHEALFVYFSKKDPKEAHKWWHRAERAKRGLSNSPATDVKPSGCAGIFVIGSLLSIWLLS
jgi:hypothetical protein